MSTKQVYDYVMKTPRNTNPAVLSSMLGHLSWNNLKDKPFYSETETHTLMDNVMIKYGVTPVDPDSHYSMHSFSYPYTLKPGDDITVIFDGETYKIENVERRSEDGFFFFDQYNEYGDQIFIMYNFENRGDGEPNWEFKTPADCTVSVIITQETVHQVPPMFIPNSVWTEEETTTILDNVKFERTNDSTPVSIPFTMKHGDVVTVVVDGVQFTPEVDYNDEDRFFYMDCWSDEADIGAIVVNNVRDEGGNNWYIAADGIVSIIVTRNVVKTNCDLMIDAHITDNTDDVQLLSGDYATAKAKIMKGLPVYTYTHLVYEWMNGDNVEKETVSEIGATSLMERGGEEFLFIHSGFVVLPNNDVFID